MKFDISDYVSFGCQLTNTLVVFSGIYELTDGYPCLECAFKNECETTKRLERFDNQKK